MAIQSSHRGPLFHKERPHAYKVLGKQVTFFAPSTIHFIDYFLNKLIDGINLEWLLTEKERITMDTCRIYLMQTMQDKY